MLAAMLTVAIVGSAVLLWHLRTRHRNRYYSINRFVNQLDLLGPAEIAERAAFLRDHPDDARQVVTSVLRRLRRERSGRARLACVRLVQAFAPDDARVADRLFELRGVADETVAAEAVGALARVKPPQRAADYLGRCLGDPVTPAVVDVACESLLGLGAAGRDALADHFAGLSIDRRVWLVGLICDRRPTDMHEWLALMASDSSMAVQERAKAALKSAEISPGKSGARG